MLDEEMNVLGEEMSVLGEEIMVLGEEMSVLGRMCSSCWEGHPGKKACPRYLVSRSTIGARQRAVPLYINVRPTRLQLRVRMHSACTPSASTPLLTFEVGESLVAELGVHLSARDACESGPLCCGCREDAP